MKQLWTKWGEKLDTSEVLSAYPRELLRRNHWVNLNGYWSYVFTGVQKETDSAEPAAFPEKWDGKILVPFSPESVLSGVSRQLKPKEWLWYRRTLPAQVKRRDGYRVLLHFGAVDQSCVIYINRKRAGEHLGGYLPFDLDITDFLQEDAEESAETEIIVRVRDLSDTSFHARGRQSLRRKKGYHTAVSGIWQTVWLEEVPDNHIDKLDVKPDPETGYVSLTVHSPLDAAVKIIVHEPEIAIDSEISQLDEGTLMQRVFFTGRSNHEITMRIPHPHLWSCAEPWLYRIDIQLGEDLVSSYFSFRSVTIEKDAEGIPRICLNHQPMYLRGVEDQGIWPDGLYTAPSDAAMISDLTEMKRAGFTMVRKTAKIEPDRWYYHCDRLGILVWQDIVNGGEPYKDWYIAGIAKGMAQAGTRVPDTNEKLLSRENGIGREEFRAEIRLTAYALQGHPSVSCWTLFDEGRGQFETKACTNILKEADPEKRPVDSASGWFDQGCGDFISVHADEVPERVRRGKKRAFILSGISGPSLQIPGHSASEKRRAGGNTCQTEEEFSRAFYEGQKKAEGLIPKGLCASVYRQWTDVEGEENGIYTWDRKVRKLKEPEPEIIEEP